MFPINPFLFPNGLNNSKDNSVLHTSWPMSL